MNAPAVRRRRNYIPRRREYAPASRARRVGARGGRLGRCPLAERRTVAVEPDECRPHTEVRTGRPKDHRQGKRTRRHRGAPHGITVLARLGSAR